MLRRLAWIALLLVLAGCSGAVDGEQARLCRLTLPAVHPDASAIVVTAASAAAAPYGVSIDYRVREGGVDLQRTVWCGFAGSGTSSDPLHLTSYASFEGRYSAIKLHILNRYWLDRVAVATLADPGPGETAVAPFALPAPATYFLQASANALPSTAMTMMIAVAYSLIYGLVGRINLAFGQIAMMGGAGAVLGGSSALLSGSPVWLVLAAAGLTGVCVAALAGSVVERYVFAPLAFRSGQALVVATLAAGIVIEEALRIGQRTEGNWLPPSLTSVIPLASADTFVATVTGMQLVVALIATAVALGLVAMMRWSAFGRHWRAVADDPVMAAMLGISVSGVMRETFLLAAALAGVAGAIMSINYGGAGYEVGIVIGLKGLVAAVLGGIGSIGGALMGGLAVGLFEAFWSAYLPIEQRDLAVLLLLVAAFVFRPNGLFGAGPDRVRPV